MNCGRVNTALIYVIQLEMTAQIKTTIMLGKKVVTDCGSEKTCVGIFTLVSFGNYLTSCAILDCSHKVIQGSRPC